MLHWHALKIALSCKNCWVRTTRMRRCIVKIFPKLIHVASIILKTCTERMTAVVLVFIVFLVDLFELN